LKPDGTILLYDVAPLIADAARQLKANGVNSIGRSGRLMTRLFGKTIQHSLRHRRVRGASNATGFACRPTKRKN
jgi:hypothetical protein